MLKVAKSRLTDIRYVGDRIFLVTNSPKYEKSVFMWDRCIILHTHTLAVFVRSKEDKDLKDEICCQISNKELSVVNLQLHHDFSELDEDIKGILIQFFTRLKEQPLEIVKLIHSFFISDDVFDISI